ncbi:SMI1/KNR4 family protein [Streptomyces sp. NPDC097619]|uniref:SMI1/KNR4 family protein n=1 Tax=Streptomyces sp. NPDC097619 TaxID=3157228 RepID=UPI00331B766B
MTDHPEDRAFPAALTAIAAVEFPYGEDESNIDYEPHDAFLSAEDTTDWIRSWTGNDELDGDRFRVFGQDGTGGYAAFWMVREGRPVEEQPVVFLGSEGATGPVAPDLASFLWLLAGGLGPMEVVEYGAHESEPNRELTALAERFAPQARRSAIAVHAAAVTEFPDFEDVIQKLCR